MPYTPVTTQCKISDYLTDEVIQQIDLSGKKLKQVPTSTNGYLKIELSHQIDPLNIEFYNVKCGVFSQVIFADICKC